MAKISALPSIDAKSAQDILQQSKLAEKIKSLSKQEFKSEKEIEKAVSGFEALLLHQLMKSMWESVEFTGFLCGDNTEGKIYRDMLSEAIAESAAKGRGIGVKQYLKAELAKYGKAEKDS